MAFITINGFKEEVYEVFSGCPEEKDGYVYPNDLPGLGIDIDEEKAKKYPLSVFECTSKMDVGPFATGHRHVRDMIRLEWIQA